MRIRLRQIVMVATDLEAAESAIVDALDVEVCHRDPGVAAFGLRNALFPIGDKLLEVVSPTETGTTAGRFLDRRGHDAGYMVMFEVDDLDDVRGRIAAAGARIVYEAADEGIIGLHLHPADVGGAILSIDATDTWGEWPWAGPGWREHVRTDRVTDVLGVVVDADDPDAMAARWSAVLGRRADGRRIELDEGEIEFVPARDGSEGVTGFRLAAADGAAPIDTVICGCRFTTA